MLVIDMSVRDKGINLPLFMGLYLYKTIRLVRLDVLLIL